MKFTVGNHRKIGVAITIIIVAMLSLTYSQSRNYTKRQDTSALPPRFEGRINEQAI
jgi:hypothetical protein